MRIAIGIVCFHAAAVAARNLDLVITGWVLDGVAGLLVVLLLVVFQPELRHAVMRLDSLLRLGPRPVALLAQASRAMSNAAFSMAKNHLGALLVITRRDSIAELVSRGVTLDAEISVEVIEALFQKTSPLHDGAAVIQGNRVRAANIVLPLAQRAGLPPFYGTRHRAALGLAERSDALVVAVSEERGEVTLVQGRDATLMHNAGELASTLQGLQTEPSLSWNKRIRRALGANLGFKFAALGLAALLWGASSLVVGTTIRTVVVPVEFSNVPPGMDVAEQSTDSVQVQLRGSAFVMNSLNLDRLVAQFSLNNGKEGWQNIVVKRGAFNLPPGVALERVWPPDVSARLVRRAVAAP